MLIYLVLNKHYDVVRAFKTLLQAQFFVRMQKDSINYSIQHIKLE